MDNRRVKYSQKAEMAEPVQRCQIILQKVFLRAFKDWITNK